MPVSAAAFAPSPAAAMAPRPALHCTLYVAAWYGPSQLLQTELRRWTAEQGIGFAAEDTMAGPPGLKALLAPGTLCCTAPEPQRQTTLPVAPLGTLASRLQVRYPAAYAPVRPVPMGPFDGLGRAVWLNDVPATAWLWDSLPTELRVMACTAAAAIGANAVLTLVLRRDASLARAHDPLPAGNTALHYAALAGNAAGVRILLAHRARADARNPVATEPTHDAARAASPEILAQLSGHASLQRANRYGDTSLHRLALYGRDKPAADLLACCGIICSAVRAEQGGQSLEPFVNALNGDGFTALDLAVAMGLGQLAERLRQNEGQHSARWRSRRAPFAPHEVLHDPRRLQAPPAAAGGR